jgi:hypothetical protein
MKSREEVCDGVEGCFDLFGHLFDANGYNRLCPAHPQFNAVRAAVLNACRHGEVEYVAVCGLWPTSLDSNRRGPGQWFEFYCVVFLGFGAGCGRGNPHFLRPRLSG